MSFIKKVINFLFKARCTYCGELGWFNKMEKGFTFCEHRECSDEKIFGIKRNRRVKYGNQR